MPTIAQQQQAEQEKNKKKQLEAALALLLFLFINKTAALAKKTFIEQQQVLNLSTQQQSLVLTLAKSAKTTTDFFTNAQLKKLYAQLKDANDGNTITLTDEQTTQLKRIIDAQSQQQANTAAAQILKTMQKDLNDAFIDAQSQKLSVNATATTATRNWKNKTKARTDPQITNAQVQGNAEQSKDTTTSFVVNNLMAQTALRTATKTWLTVGDDKVRPAHAAAQGQTVPINAFYIVGGEKLQYPADPRGSPSNIINCRCSSLTLLS